MILEPCTKYVKISVYRYANLLMLFLGLYKMLFLYFWGIKFSIHKNHYICFIGLKKGVIKEKRF